MRNGSSMKPQLEDLLGDKQLVRIDLFSASDKDLLILSQHLVRNEKVHWQDLQQPTKMKLSLTKADKPF